MSCSELRTLLHGYIDGELDPVRNVEIEEHLRTCDACAQSLEAQRALRSALQSDDLYFRAPAGLEQKIRIAAQRPEGKSKLLRVQLRGWAAAAMAAAAVVALAFFLPSRLSRPSQTDRIAQDVVSAHIRSLMPGHLTDVPSSEHHTVKPWFAGRLDFSPAVVDLTAEDFPLVGGRLDYAAGRPVAALVYRRGKHLINLFTWPAEPVREAAEKSDARQGYNVVFWTRAGTNYWAISDVNRTDLRRFADFVRARTQ